MDRFDDFFPFTIRQGTELLFLIFRIIQSDHGISIDQTNYITKSVLKDYFGENTKVNMNCLPLIRQPIQIQIVQCTSYESRRPSSSQEKVQWKI